MVRGVTIFKLKASQPKHPMEDLLSYTVAREAGELGLSFKEHRLKYPSYLWKHILGNKDHLGGENMLPTEAGLPFHEDIHQIVQFHVVGG